MRSDIFIGIPERLLNTLYNEKRNNDFDYYPLEVIESSVVERDYRDFKEPNTSPPHAIIIIKDVQCTKGDEVFDELQRLTNYTLEDNEYSCFARIGESWDDLESSGDLKKFGFDLGAIFKRDFNYNSLPF